MAVALDLADIQGNILGAYGKQGFPKGRFMTLHVDDAAGGRKFVTALLPQVTTALRWESEKAKLKPGAVRVPRPEVAVNIAFSFYGLLRLGVPIRTLRGMPDEFIDGMMARAPMLGDDFGRGQQAWDKVWTAATSARDVDSNTVHMLVTLNAQMKRDGSAVDALEATTRTIEALCRSSGVRILPGHNPPGQQPAASWQELSALMGQAPDGTYFPMPTEHFGFTDAIGDPVFEGQFGDRAEANAEVGNGALDGAGKWRPLATGEFLLGYPDEAQEIAGAAMPLDFSRNGTFMAYRKLHQNVAAFRAFMTETAARFGAVFGIDDPSAAEDTLKAKIAGRWQDGVPLARARRPSPIGRHSISNIRTFRRNRTIRVISRAARPWPISPTARIPPGSSVRSPPIHGASTPVTAWGPPATSVRCSPTVAASSGADCPMAVLRQASPTRASTASSC